MTRLVACLDCHALISPGPRCYACRRKRETAYEATRPEHHSVYRSHAWRVLSEKVRRAGTRCTWCLRPLPYRRRIADHVEPIEKRPDLALEPTNVVVACMSCNVRRGKNWKLPDPGGAVEISTSRSRLDPPLTAETRMIASSDRVSRER